MIDNIDENAWIEAKTLCAIIHMTMSLWGYALIIVMYKVMNKCLIIIRLRELETLQVYTSRKGRGQRTLEWNWLFF